MSEPVLAVSQLTVQLASDGREPGSSDPAEDRSGVPLLGPLDFVIGAGERVGLIGPSGAGKSLTIACVLGLLEPGLLARGSLLSNGERFDLAAGYEALAPLRGRRFTWLPQHAADSLSPVDRIGRQLDQLSAIHGTGFSAKALLARVGLVDADAARYPHELSGGMAQRASLAMALACRPALLLADEPCSALDGPARAAFLDTLERCSTDDGMALLFVSHDLADTRRLCPRMLVINDGRIVEHGTTAGLTRAPRHPTTRAIVEAAQRSGARRPKPKSAEVTR